MKSVSRFILFGVSGVIGFLVDTFVLYQLKGALGLYGARLVSFLCAVMATWLFNRSITFREKTSGHSPGKEFSIYLGLMLAGGAVNYATYSLLVHQLNIVAEHPVLGVAAGSIAGMMINLFTSRFVLFRLNRENSPT